MRTLGHAVTIASALLCALVLGGCSYWSDLHIFSTAPKNKPAELTEVKTTLAVKPLWNANVGKAGKYFFTPAMLVNDVVVAGAAGIVEKIVLTSGAVVWRINLDQPLSAGVGADAETIAPL